MKEQPLLAEKKQRITDALEGVSSQYEPAEGQEVHDKELLSLITNHVVTDRIQSQVIIRRSLRRY